MHEPETYICARVRIHLHAGCHPMERQDYVQVHHVYIIARIMYMYSTYQ